MNRREFLNKAKGVLGIAVLGAGAVAIATKKPPAKYETTFEASLEHETLFYKVHVSEELLLDSPQSVMSLIEKTAVAEMRCAIEDRYPQLIGRI